MFATVTLQLMAVSRPPARPASDAFWYVTITTFADSAGPKLVPVSVISSLPRVLRLAALLLKAVTRAVKYPEITSDRYC